MNGINKNKKSSYVNLAKESTFLQILPIIFFTAVIMIVLRMVVYERPMDQFLWTFSSNQIMDADTYVRMMLIIAVAAVSLFSIIAGVLTDSAYVKRSFFYIPMAVYCVLVIASYLFSEYKEFALLGIRGRMEGTLPILGYMVMLFYTFNYVNSLKNVKWITYSVAVVCGVLALIGAGQYFGFNILDTDMIKKTYIPSQYWDQLDKVFFAVTSGVTQTLGNQNYVGFYTVLPVSLFSMIAIGSKDIKKKIGWSLLTGLLLFNLFAAASTGGIVGALVAALVAVVLLNKKLVEWWKSVAILLVVAIIMSAAALPGLFGSNLIGTEINKADTNIEEQSPQQSVPTNNQTAEEPASVGAVANEQKPPTDYEIIKSYMTPYGPSDSRKKVDYIVTGAQDIAFSIDGQELTLKTKDGNFIGVLDSSGNELPLENELCSVTTENISNGAKILIVKTDDKNWIFILSKGEPLFVNPVYKMVKLDKISSFGFENYQQFATGRGYIWSRTLPLLKDTLLFGFGADTFAMHFPQLDYAGRYNVGFASGWTDEIIDKPHNMYLGAAANTGVLSAIALIVMYGFYILQSIKIYRKQRFDEEIDFIGFGIFMGVCGFLVAGLVNDSTVSVMPIFYGLLGTGLAINYMIQNRRPLKAVK